MSNFTSSSPPYQAIDKALEQYTIDLTALTTLTTYLNNILTCEHSPIHFDQQDIPTIAAIMHRSNADLYTRVAYSQESQLAQQAPDDLIPGMPLDPNSLPANYTLDAVARDFVRHRAALMGQIVPRNSIIYPTQARLRFYTRSIFIFGQLKHILEDVSDDSIYNQHYSSRSSRSSTSNSSSNRNSSSSSSNSSSSSRAGGKSSSNNDNNSNNSTRHNRSSNNPSNTTQRHHHDSNNSTTSTTSSTHQHHHPSLSPESQHWANEIKKRFGVSAHDIACTWIPAQPFFSIMSRFVMLESHLRESLVERYYASRLGSGMSAQQFSDVLHQKLQAAQQAYDDTPT